jgi:hypothetical protein
MLYKFWLFLENIRTNSEDLVANTSTIITRKAIKITVETAYMNSAFANFSISPDWKSFANMYERAENENEMRTAINARSSHGISVENHLLLSSCAGPDDGMYCE